MKLKQEIRIKTSYNTRKLSNKKIKQKDMDLIVFRKTKFIQKLVLSSLMWIKEDEFLLVTRKRLHKRLETVAIHFEATGSVEVE